MLGLLLGCFLLVVLPIFAVQYPRFIETLPEVYESGTVETGFDGTGETTPTGDFRRKSSIPQKGEVQETDSNEDMSMRRMAKRKRMPWEPPFPTSPKTREETYLVLEPSLRGRKESRHSPQVEKVPAQHIPSTEPLPSPLFLVKPPVTSPPPAALKEPHPSPSLRFSHDTEGFHFSLLKIAILVLTVLIFLFAFAVLIAHCVAWFIVYKTESRLGEVRKGLLREGDMRLCLCTRG